MKEKAATPEQLSICRKYGAEYMESEAHLKVGIAWNVKEGLEPIHGLRLLPEGDTTGWYIWADEYSDADDFFAPLHVVHIDEWDPKIRKYLGLAPGWRFVIAEDYEDVWFDEQLLNQE
ncbi:immunity protein Imm33 domain-containing protein [Paenibacillus massiliensis]|uniref:immunity protein Imm33 domain-containing protein n=1 Tax=Paenibacillus sp. FSL K6-1230 TaxID=2921603 RepID=UPI000377A675